MQWGISWMITGECVATKQKAPTLLTISEIALIKDLIIGGCIKVSGSSNITKLPWLTQKTSLVKYSRIVAWPELNLLIFSKSDNSMVLSQKAALISCAHGSKEK